MARPEDPLPHAAGLRATPRAAFRHRGGAAPRCGIAAELRRGLARAGAAHARMAVACGTRPLRTRARCGAERSLRARGTSRRMKSVRAFWALLPPPLRRRCLVLAGVALVMAVTTVAGLV